MKADAAPGTAPSKHNKGGFLKPRLSSNSWTPGRRLSPRGGSYLGSALGAVAFPGDASRRDEAGGGQEKAPDLDDALPILREPPSRRLRRAEVQRSPGRAERRPRAGQDRRARRRL